MHPEAYLARGGLVCGLEFLGELARAVAGCGKNDE